MKALILVGGEGSRLKPFTENIPKVLVSIKENKTFLEYVFDWLKSQGITNIVLLTGHFAEKIEQYCGDGSKFGLRIEYTGIHEVLGTAGQLKPAKKFIDSTFILLNGDSIFTIDLKKLIEFHQLNKAKMTIALKHIENTKEYGLVHTNNQGKIIKFTEKGNLVSGVNTINGGVYVLEPELFDLIPAGKVSLEKEILPKINQLYGLEFTNYFIDIGTPKNYDKFKKDAIQFNMEDFK